MEKLMNRDGMEIQNTAQAVFKELMQGTGCVMGDKLSIYLEARSITEKTIVVAQAPGPTSPGRSEKFASGQFKAAWDLLQEWGLSN